MRIATTGSNPPLAGWDSVAFYYKLRFLSPYAAYRRCITPPLFQGGKSEVNLYWGGMPPKPPCYFWEVRKALIRLAKSKIWSLIEKVTKTLSEGFRSPRRNKLRYAQYNQRLNCWTLRYCSLIEKNLRIFFEEEKQRKSSELLFFWPGTNDKNALLLSVPGHNIRLQNIAKIGRFLRRRSGNEAQLQSEIFRFAK